MKGFIRRLFKRKKTLIATSSLIAVFLMCFLLTSRMYADTIPNVSGAIPNTDLLFEFTGNNKTLRIYVDESGTTNNTTVSSDTWKNVIGDDKVNRKYVENLIFDNSSGKLMIKPYGLTYSGESPYFNYCKCIDLQDTEIIPTISYGGSAKTYGMFYFCRNLNEIRFTGDKSLRNIGIDASGMFYNTLISDFDEILEGFDFSNCVYIDRMFDSCENLSSFDFDKMNLDRTKSINMSCIFNKCDKLTSIDFGDAEWSSLSLQSAFSGCDLLEEVDLTKISEITSIYYAFEDSPKLSKVYFGQNDCPCTNFNFTFWGTSIESFNFNKTPNQGEANTIKLSSDISKLDLSGAFRECILLKSLSFNGLNNTYPIDMSNMLIGSKNVELLDLTGVNFPDESKLENMAGNSGVDIIMLPDYIDSNCEDRYKIGSGYYPVKMTGLEPSQSDTYMHDKNSVVINLQAKGTYDYYKKGPKYVDMITAHSDKEFYEEGEEPKVTYSSEYPCLDLDNEEWRVECASVNHFCTVSNVQPLVRLYEKDSDAEHYTFGWDFNNGMFALENGFLLHLPKGKTRIDLHCDWIDAYYFLVGPDDLDKSNPPYITSTGYVELDAPEEEDYLLVLALLPNDNLSSLNPLELQDIQNNPYEYCYFDIATSILKYDDNIDWDSDPGEFDETEKTYNFNSFNKDSSEGEYSFVFLLDGEYREDYTPTSSSNLTLKSANKDVYVKVENPEGGTTQKTKERLGKNENTFTTKLSPSGDNNEVDIDVYSKDLVSKEFVKVPAKCITDYDVSGGKDFTADFIDGDYKFVVTFKKGEAGPSPNPPGGGGGGGSSVSSPKVTFNLLSSNSKENESLLKSNEKELKKITFDGNKIKTLPSTLTRDGFIFDGWYKDKDFKEEVKLGDSLQGNVTLYAKWKEIENFTPYIRGYDDGEFKPNRYLSRAEVATIISRLCDEFDEDKNYGIDLFPDTKKNFWYSNYIKFASENKFFEGYPDGEFKPDRTITRGELVKVLVSFSKIELSDDEEKSIKTFSDISDDDFFKDMANRLLTKGLIKGYEDGSFKGNSPVTRAEACVMINSILESTGKTLNVSDKSLNFTDVKKTDWFYTDILKSVISN